VANQLTNWFRNLRTFLFAGADGQAIWWSLVAEGISLLAHVLEKGIEGLQKGEGQEFPYSLSVAIELLSIQWQLIAIGLGAMLGSFVTTPKDQRQEGVLLGPYAVVCLATLGIELIYVVWPWVGPPLLRVPFTVLIGLGVLYYCVLAAKKVRQPPRVR
jgi:hypothetical protein